MTQLASQVKSSKSFEANKCGVTPAGGSTFVIVGR